MAKATAATVSVTPGEASQERDTIINTAIATTADGSTNSMTTHTVATVPDATLFQGRTIEVTDGLAGAWISATSDGTIWRRSSDGLVIAAV